MLSVRVSPNLNCIPGSLWYRHRARPGLARQKDVYSPKEFPTCIYTWRQTERNSWTWGSTWGAAQYSSVHWHPNRMEIGEIQKSSLRLSNDLKLVLPTLACNYPIHSEAPQHPPLRRSCWRYGCHMHQILPVYPIIKFSTVSALWSFQFPVG